MAAGANGAGLGSALYKPGLTRRRWASAPAPLCRRWPVMRLGRARLPRLRELRICACARSQAERFFKEPIMRQARVAVVQAGTSLFNTPRTLERMEAHCRAAQQEGAQLVVFPEAYVGGYPKGLDFGARIGSRTAEGREDYLRYWRSAIDLTGPNAPPSAALPPR
jgi:hypothetical protein